MELRLTMLCDQGHANDMGDHVEAWELSKATCPDCDSKDWRLEPTIKTKGD